MIRLERGRMAPKWRSWPAVSLVLIGIWAVASFPFDGPMSFWPIYPTGIWGRGAGVLDAFREPLGPLSKTSTIVQLFLRA